MGVLIIPAPNGVVGENMRNLAVNNWLRRARKNRLSVVNVEDSDLTDVAGIMVTVDDAEAAVSDVEASELGVSAENAGASDEVSGTPVSFVRLDD